MFQKENKYIEDVDKAFEDLFKAIVKVHPTIAIDNPAEEELYLTMHTLRFKLKELKKQRYGIDKKKIEDALKPYIVAESVELSSNVRTANAYNVVITENEMFSFFEQLISHVLTIEKES